MVYRKKVLGLFLRLMPYIFSKREKRSGGDEKRNCGDLLQAFCGGCGKESGGNVPQFPSETGPGRGLICEVDL